MILPGEGTVNRQRGEPDRQADTGRWTAESEMRYVMNRDKDREYFIRMGTAIFLALAGAIAFFFVLYRFDVIRNFISTIMSALQPLVIGIVFSYLLTPVARMLEKWLKKVPVISKFARLLSIILSFVLAFAVLGAFCALMLPELVSSVSGLVQDLPEMLQTQLGRLKAYLQGNDEATAAVLKMLTAAETYLTDWIKTNLLSTITSVAGQVLSIGSAVINVMLSGIVTVYLMLDRERYVAQLRKLFCASCRNRRLQAVVLDTAHQINLIFSGFIRGKLVDSVIVGIICFICLSLMKMPYTLVISVIVGVTNIIPMFGPWIGAVPSAFLLLLVSPVKCLIFLVFIIILQQFDGNILGPRILGNSTGLSALYVTIAMLVFGKLMGFLGMLIGVPLFASIYYVVKRVAEYSLKTQDLPVRTEGYMEIPQPPKEIPQADGAEGE